MQFFKSDPPPYSETNYPIKFTPPHEALSEFSEACQGSGVTIQYEAQIGSRTSVPDIKMYTYVTHKGSNPITRFLRSSWYERVEGKLEVDFQIIVTLPSGYGPTAEIFESVKSAVKQVNDFKRTALIEANNSSLHASKTDAIEAARCAIYKSVQSLEGDLRSGRNSEMSTWWKRGTYIPTPVGLVDWKNLDTADYTTPEWHSYKQHSTALDHLTDGPLYFLASLGTARSDILSSSHHRPTAQQHSANDAALSMLSQFEAVGSRTNPRKPLTQTRSWLSEVRGH